MTRTNRLLLAAVVIAAVLAAYWFYALAPKRERAALLAEQVAAKQAELQQAQALVVQYQRAQRTYTVNYATVARLGKAVPADDDVRSLIVQLTAAAGGSGVDFRTIEVGGGSGGSSPTVAGGPSTGPSTSAEAGAQALPPGAVTVGSAGFSALPLTFGFRGSFANLSEFFARLERFVTVRDERIDVTGRLLRLESVTLEPEEGSSGLRRIRAAIGASAYLVPATQGVTAGATASGPAPVTPAPAAGQPASGAPGPPSTPPATTAAATGATP